jgi:MYXO-CTERM domain-containing protein
MIEILGGGFMRRSAALLASAVALTFVQIARAAPAWNAAGSMAEGRLLHTATALGDGRVLVAGGFNLDDAGTYNIAAAEIYDPAGDAWGRAGRMQVARSLHTATLLESGEVVVIGSGAVAEIYTPASNTWRSAGSLVQNRLYHTATRLPSGKVLVAGGWDTMQHFDSAEIFDPATGMFTPTGSMSAKRRAHVAVLLTTGKVLITAGTDGEALTSAEIYDPVAGMFTPTGSLSVGRGKNGGRIDAVLLASGEVLLPGSPPDPSEIYDPTVGTWRTAASMTESRTGYVAVRLESGQVLVAGGNGALPEGGVGPLASSEIYDPATGRWSFAGGMLSARINAGIARLKTGWVLVAGGGFGVASSEKYGPPALAPPDAGSTDAGDGAADASVDAPTTNPDAGSTGAGGGAADAGGAGGGGAGTTSDDSGCGCRIGADGRQSAAPAGLSFLLVAVALSRRRRTSNCP